MKATKKELFAGLLSMVLALLLGIVIPVTPVKAASGTVYTCSVTPCYAHPVTGEIEDSGGEASYATGQGMVEGAVYTTGILEVTDSGEYYLTIRMSLMDLTSGHSFWVQNVGDSGWSTPAMGITGNGSDSNGNTADICIQVPSENCVVRGSMYVDLMGRDVIFYCYPSNFSEGNNTDMNATMVTSTAGSDDAANIASVDNSGTDTVDNSGSEYSGASNLQVQATQETTSTPTPAPTATPVQSQAVDAGGEDKDKKTTKLQSSIDTPAIPSAEEPSTDSTLNKSQGLSLSTAEEGSGTMEAEGNSGGNQAVTLIIAITVSGLILMGAAAGIVYLFRKNWRRWGGGDDDDE